MTTNRTKILAVAGKWAIATDAIQCILLVRQGKQWRTLAFVRSTIDILARCMREKDCPPEASASLLEAASIRFSDPRGWWCPGRQISRFPGQKS